MLFCINSNETCCNLYVLLFAYVSEMTATFKHQCTVPSQAFNLFLFSIFVIPSLQEEQCNTKWSNEHGWHLALTRSDPTCMTHWSFLFDPHCSELFCECHVLLPKHMDDKYQLAQQPTIGFLVSLILPVLSLSFKTKLVKYDF